MVSVLTFTVVGSYIASLLPSRTMGSFFRVMTFLLGVKFIIQVQLPATKKAMMGVSAHKRAVQSIVCGVLIGFYRGFIGAGGGIGDAVDFDLRARLRTENRSRHQRIYHDVHRADRCSLAASPSAACRIACGGCLRDFHACLGSYRSGFCQ